MANPVKDWLVVLDFDERWDAELLAEHFRSDLCSVFFEEDDAFLRSSSFVGIEDHKRIISLARALLEAMNGTAKLIAPWFNPVGSTSLKSVHENGNRGVVMVAGPLTFRMPQTVPPREQGEKLSEAELWLELSQKNAEVATALRIFGTRPHSWVNLYNLYEIIRTQIGSDGKIVARGWTTSDELSRFRYAANSAKVSGDDARHQKPIGEASQPAMTINDAINFIRHLVRSWLASL
jgi:hypothetical protein